ncbi:MAG: penicillin-binding protein 1C [Marinosulfonomonas sp.]
MNRLAAFTACVLVAGLGHLGLDVWVDRTELPNLVPETSVTVVDRDGALLRAYPVADGRWRMPADTGAIDPAYLGYLIAFEDKRFYQHSGVDLRAMARAAMQALWNGKIVSGGSTLTMQVARLLEDGSTGKLPGKLRQIRVALALERVLSKQDILDIYVKLAPMGGNLEGVRAASLAYFGKEPKRLTAAQSALLVALPQSPSARRPDRHPKAAQLARDRVLGRLTDSGVLSVGEGKAARKEQVTSRRIPFPMLAPHMADHLVAEFPDDGNIETSLDGRLQQSLETLLADRTAKQGRSLTGAILVADHQSGEILASVGSADFFDIRRQGFVDMTRAVRSPGSTLKPLIYGLSFEAGLAHPETLIQDRPTDFGGYVPTNFDRVYHGTVHVRKALQLSLNIPAVAALDAVGPARFLSRLRRAGVAPKLPAGDRAGLAIALGGFGISLRDLVGVYASIAHDGQVVLLSETGDAQITKRRLLDPIPAWYVVDILAGTPPPTTGRIDEIAFKTGTSYGHRDAWAVGFDGQHVIGVWLGRADGTAVPGIQGLSTAAPLLFEAFSRLKDTPSPLAPAPRAALTVPNSGLPAPLRTFRTRGQQITSTQNQPEISYPPDGAEVEVDLAQGQDTLVIKLRNGTPPFSWIVNGQAQQELSFERQKIWHLTEPGFVHVSVVDSRGLSANAQYFVK